MIEVKNSSATTIQQNIYDAFSRKIATTAGGATTLMIYDGWNPIAEYTGSTPTLTKTNLWGLDLSGTMQGAGGVGGLLAVTEIPVSSAPVTYYPLFDGNGNITEYIDSSATVVAHYEYDPFGNTTVATGTKANDFTHRFSTKPLDPITGLYYYGYRYYDPITGRWPSRDPIEEKGGLNLYAFIGNFTTIIWDILGKQPPKIPYKDYLQKYLDAYPQIEDIERAWVERLLPAGCYGATCVNLGDEPRHEFCYKTKQLAEDRKAIMTKNQRDCCPQIYGVRLHNDSGMKNYWNDKEKSMDVSFNKKGKADMTNWNKSSRPDGKYIRYDYGFVNPDGSITHADEAFNPDLNKDGKGDNFPDGDIYDKTNFFISSFEHFTRKLDDFNLTVWCVQCRGNKAGPKNNDNFVIIK